MARAWVLRILACLAAVTVLVTGCSQTHEQEPKAAAPTTAAASPTLAPLGPTDFPMPAAARSEDASGAEAFIRYYFDLLNRSLKDMDTQYLRTFAQQCEVCDRIIRETEGDATNGYHYDGGELVISSPIAVAITAPGRAESAFLADQEPLTVRDSAGRPVPNLTLGAKPRLSSGARTMWDASTSSWKMAVLTLG